MTIDGQQIAGLSVLTAVVTAGSNFLSTWYFTGRQLNQSAKYYGVRIAIALDGFAYECASLISGETTWYASNGAAGSKFSTLPPLAIDPATDWKSLDLALVDRVLTFQNDVLRAQSYISDESFHLNEEFDSAEKPAGQAGLLGFVAYQLGLEFRKKYSTGSTFEPLHPSNYVETLQMKHDLKSNEYRIQRNLENG